MPLFGQLAHDVRDHRISLRQRGIFDGDRRDRADRAARVVSPRRELGLELLVRRYVSVERDVSAVRLDDAPDDREPEPGSGYPFGRRRTKERFERRVRVIRRHSLAVVGDPQHVLAIRRGSDDPELERNVVATILHRIFTEVPQHFTKQTVAAPDRCRWDRDV